MYFFRVFFVLILLAFVAIGDSVLFILKKIFKIIKAILLLIKTFLVSLLLFPKEIGRLLRRLKIISSFPIRFKSSEITIFEREKKSFAKVKDKKKSKKKPKTMFFLPFWFKVKYFVQGSIFSFIFIFLPLLFIIFLQELPSPKTLVLGQIAQTTKIYDRNGVLLYQMYADQNRTVVPLFDIPKYLQEATIAIEDKDFYKHAGFDLSAIIRSVIKNTSGGQLQGGSTITQQLIKSALLTPETSLTRKVKELLLALWTEKTYSKTTILEMYFNQVAYGGITWGVEAAAQTYFGKSVKDLDLAESAFLAGVPKAPSIYSPYSSTPTLWKKRQAEVLQKMAELGYITKKEQEDAQKKELLFRPLQVPLKAPHFVMYVRDLLVKKYGLPFVERGGLTVITSLDLNLQENAQKIVSDEVSNNTLLNLTNGATVITDPKNGDILAMVGSRDFYDPQSGNVNVATSLRQPGSSIKVVTYAAALSRGFTAASILDDSPVVFKTQGGQPYAPVNYDGKFHGRPSLRIAFANSFNIPAVRTLNQIGIQNFIDLGKRMGITTWGDSSQYGLSITLGAAEVRMVDMTTLYGVLANGGVRVGVNPILKISDGKGNIMEEKKDIDGVRVLSESVTFIISSILSDNKARALEFGSNSPLNIQGHTIPVKTGTSDNKRDNWTIGYTQERLVAVWVGNNDNSPMNQQLASGITGAAPIWNKLMTMLLQGRNDEKLQIPQAIITKPCLGRIEYFVRGTENSVNCTYIPTPSVSQGPN